MLRENTCNCETINRTVSGCKKLISINHEFERLPMFVGFTTHSMISRLSNLRTFKRKLIVLPSAGRGGFEPPVDRSPQQFSRLSHSTTLAPPQVFKACGQNYSIGNLQGIYLSLGPTVPAWPKDSEKANIGGGEHPAYVSFFG
jgi:hypothetical protein